MQNWSGPAGTLIWRWRLDEPLAGGRAAPDLTAKAGDEEKLARYVTAKDVKLPPVAGEFTDTDIAFAKQITTTDDGVGADWPISYEDLRPHYEQVEAELPVAGQNWPWGYPHRPC